MADMANTMMSSFANAYGMGRQIAQDDETKRNTSEIKNVFSEVMKDPDQYGGPEGALREASKRFGQSGNTMGFETVAKMANQLQQQRQQFQQQLAPAAQWILTSPKEERPAKIEMFKKRAKEIGFQLPEDIDEATLLSVTGQKDYFEMFNKQFEMEKKRAEVGKVEQETKAKEAQTRLFESEAKWYERRKDTPGSGRGSDKSLTEKQAGEYAEAQEEWDNMSDEEKEDLMAIDLKKYQSLKAKASLFRGDQRVESKKTKKPKGEGKKESYLDYLNK